ncbi:hypothetical protein KAJ87_02675 [Candidatus Pacearchaeota archaeon]|nr:hypothetical protein [Candidatus Pacearchaeota archaeon]
MKKVKKENKEKIMEMIRKAGDPDNYKISWDVKGVPYKIQEKANIKKGGNSRAKGARFELKVRGDLENKGRIVDKWTNNVDLEAGKIIISRKYNPFKKMLIVGTGFPDFISIKNVHGEMYSVIGVEVKINGILSKIEKEKCAWYLKNKIFSQIWIAKKGKKRGQIEYDDFQEKYGEKYNKT